MISHLTKFILGLTTLAVLLTGIPAMAEEVRPSPAINEWVDGLRAPDGTHCCDLYDGQAIEAEDYEFRADGHFWVFFAGKYRKVENDSLILEPNRLGRAIVWPRYNEFSGGVYIACFLPGAGI